MPNPPISEIMALLEEHWRELVFFTSFLLLLILSIFVSPVFWVAVPVFLAFVLGWLVAEKTVTTITLTEPELRQKMRDERDAYFPILRVVKGEIVANKMAQTILGERLSMREFEKALNSEIITVSRKERVISFRMLRIEPGVFVMHPAASYTLSMNQTQILEHLPLALMTLDDEERVVSLNIAAQELLGDGMHIGARIEELFETTNIHFKNWIDQAKRNTAASRPKLIHRRSSDQYLHAVIKRACVDESPRLLLVLTDATMLHSMEAQFIQSQKMQAIGQLAGGVAHDFNNLLTAISGYCDLALLRHEEGDPDYDDLMEISRNAERAAELVGQLLAFSRKQRAELQAINPREVLSEISQLLTRLLGEKIRLTITHGGDLPLIHVDKRQFEQIIVNLVVNARDAMPGGGEVIIQTRPKTIDGPEFRDKVTISPGAYVSILVIDTGEGFGLRVKQKLFEPFFTTKAVGKGTGLGLSTVFGLVKQSGGFIFADSTEGFGARFEVLIPVAEGKAALSFPPPQHDQKAIEHNLDEAGPQRILLVEDEMPVRSFAARALSLKGYEVVEAASGEEALEHIARLGAEAFDLVLTDVIMPGLDGPSWVKKAQEEGADLPVIFMSGYAREVFETNYAQFSSAPMLPKPFSVAHLLETIEEALSKARGKEAELEAQEQ